jgi:hypothetical protein
MGVRRHNVLCVMIWWVVAPLVASASSRVAAPPRVAR